MGEARFNMVTFFFLQTLELHWFYIQKFISDNFALTFVLA